ETGYEAGEGAGVPAVDVRRLQPAQAGAVHREEAPVAIDAKAERLYGTERRLGVAAPAEAADLGRPLRDRAQEKGAMGDGLVARYGEVAVQRGRGLDLHCSRTAETTTPYPWRSRRSAARRASPSPATSSVSVPPRSGDTWCSSKSSMLIRSAPSAWVIP